MAVDAAVNESGRKGYHPVAYMESKLYRLRDRYDKALIDWDPELMRELSMRIDYLERQLELLGVVA